MTNLFEVVICLLLFAMALTALLRLMGYTTKDQAVVSQTIKSQIDADFFIDTVIQDVKSSNDIEVTENVLTLSNDEDSVIYAVTGNTLYRNSEEVFTQVQQASFSTTADNMIAVFVELKDGDVIDFAVRQ